jgi:hypothetical protein
MTGGLMQLVAYGAQDIYLTGNPMITYFKVVYRRHTNFAMESIEQTFSGSVGFGNKVTALISRNGDLVSGLTLEATLPALDLGDRWTEDVGHHLIDEVTVEIGGQQIDKHYGDWLEIWAQLTLPASKKVGYRKMIGTEFDAIGQPVGLIGATAGAAVGPSAVSAKLRKVYVPLQFWFCRNVGLALPLIALQYHEVKVSLKFKTMAQLQFDANAAIGTAGTASTTLSASLWADYIYLDTDERRRFAQVSHEYLIEQLQMNSSAYSATTTTTSGSQTIDLTFNHPVKELVWVSQVSANVADSVAQWSNYTDRQATTADFDEAVAGDFVLSAFGLLSHKAPRDNLTAPGVVNTGSGLNITQAAKLKLNGHDRFAERDGTYFNLKQPDAHHTAVPESPGINVYSFALKPEDHQPSGSCNFSRIDNAQLVLTIGGIKTLGAGVTRVYAVNYNVLRIMSGMGGLAYSN